MPRFVLVLLGVLAVDACGATPGPYPTPSAEYERGNAQRGEGGGQMNVRSAPAAASDRAGGGEGGSGGHGSGM